jgi:hypothetical protein
MRSLPVAGSTLLSTRRAHCHGRTTLRAVPRVERRAALVTLAALALVAGPGHSLGSPAGDPTAHPRPAPAARHEEVRLWVARDVAPGPRVRVTINTRNLTVVHLAAYRLDGVAWLLRRAQQQGRPSEPPEKGLTPTGPAGRPVREWDTTVATRHERPGPAQRDIFRSRQANLPPLPPGVYLLTARGGASEARAIVNITELAVVVKRAPRKALVWVSAYDTGAPLPGARVSLYGARSRRLASGMTRADGTCLVPAPPGSDQTVIVERNHDLAAVPSPIEDPDGILKLHFQTDRPVYRPGQTVFFKAILRRTAGQGYSPLAHTGCQVEVRDARDNPLQTERLITNPVGTLAGRVELPAEGVPGPYTVVISAGKETVYGSFTVAEYRKPEFKVTARPAQRRYLAGEPAGSRWRRRTTLARRCPRRRSSIRSGAMTPRMQEATMRNDGTRAGTATSIPATPTRRTPSSLRAPSIRTTPGV